MADEQSKFTHVGIEKRTQRQISILAKVAEPSMHIYDLVRDWANDAWEDAKQAGLVTDAMLGPAAESVAAETVK